MDKYEEILFVGGVLDMKRRNVRNGVMEQFILSMPSTRQESTKYRRERYIWETGKAEEFMIAEGMPLSQAITKIKQERP